MDDTQNFDWLSAVKSLGSTAADLANAFSKTPPKPSAPAPVASATDWKKWAPWLIGGVVALIAVVLLVRR